MLTKKHTYRTISFGAACLCALSFPYEYFVSGFLVEAASSLRLFLCGLALPLMAVSYRFKLRIALVLSAFCLGVNLTYVGPYLAPRGHAGTTGESSLKIVFMNVDRGRADAKKVLDFISAEQPDVLVIGEATEAFVDAIAPGIEQFGTTLSYYPPDEKTLGMIVLTSLPLRDNRMLHFVDSKSPQFELTLAAPAELRIITLHSHVPRNTFGYVHQRLLFDRLSEHLKESPRPSVIVGDFNATMWSPLFQTLTDAAPLRDPRLIFGVLATWAPFGLPILPIDHVLVSPEIGVAQLRVGPPIGSDHLPLIATVIH